MNDVAPVWGATMARGLATKIVPAVMGVGLASGALLASGTSAEANTCDILNFTTSTECISPVTGGPGNSNQVNESAMNSFGGSGAFGFTGWEQLAKLDREGSPDPDTTVTSTNDWFTITYLAPAEPGDPTYGRGLWSLVPERSFDPLMIYAFAIKGANDNAVYRMNTEFTDGAWFVGDLQTNSGNLPDMSNIQLFAAPIPLPPVVFMMLGAIGALVVATRRRRAAA